MVREVGGAENLLCPAKKARSPVAILYSSSADIWTVDRNFAYGFDPGSGLVTSIRYRGTEMLAGPQILKEDFGVSPWLRRRPVEGAVALTTPSGLVASSPEKPFILPGKRLWSK